MSKPLSGPVVGVFHSHWAPELGNLLSVHAKRPALFQTERAKASSAAPLSGGYSRLDRITTASAEWSWELDFVGCIPEKCFTDFLPTFAIMAHIKVLPCAAWQWSKVKVPSLVSTHRLQQQNLAIVSGLIQQTVARYLVPSAQAVHIHNNLPSSV